MLKLTAGWKSSEGQIHAAVLVANLAGTVAGKIHPAWIGLVIAAAQAGVYAVARSHVKGKALDAADLQAAVGAAAATVVGSPAAGRFGSVAGLIEEAARPGVVDPPPAIGH